MVEVAPAPEECAPTRAASGGVRRFAYWSVFVSAHNKPLEEVDAICVECSKRNESKGITGVLFLSADEERGTHEIVQLLEGPPQEIDELYAKISKDKRHKDVTVVVSYSVADRKFARCGMTWGSASEWQQIKSLLPPTMAEFDVATFEDHIQAPRRSACAVV